MKIRKLWLDGYGRFLNKEFDLAPGLQILMGPNEQGKTTVRSFITDMLYGQKTSTTKRFYSHAQDARRPWEAPDQYSGRLLYELDNRQEIEVHRNFDKQRETINVFDRTHGREITATFPQLGNREPTFAESHLGLSRDVFLNVATITHLTLDHLGDDEALTQIREKVLALADTADEGTSADSALKWIEDRIADIGRPAAHSKRPLSRAKRLLEALQHERAEALQTREETGELECARLRVREAIATLRKQQAELDREHANIQRIDRAKRLREAERLNKSLQEVTSQCFGLSEVRDFPLDQEPELRRAANVLATAVVQLERTRGELAELRRQLEAEHTRVGTSPDLLQREIPEDTDLQLANLDTKIQQLYDRHQELVAAQTEAEEHLQQMQEELAALPDFSQMGPDPVEWISQLAMSFRVAAQSRDDERAKVDQLQAEVDQLRGEVEEPEAFFAEFSDFSNEVRDYEITERLDEERAQQLRSRVDALKAQIEDQASKVPGAIVMTVVCFVFLVVFTIAAVFVIWGLFVVAALFLLGLFYYAGILLSARILGNRAEHHLARTKEELLLLEEESNARRQAMKEHVEKGGCETTRELEAKHDRYRAQRSDLDLLEIRLSEQKTKMGNEEQQVQLLFERLQDTFGQLGVELKDEDGTKEAAAKAIARYQEYRDLKRQMHEIRERLAGLQTVVNQAHNELTARERENVDLSLEARRAMREHGFAEERRYTSALNALRAYRTRCAQLREKMGRIELLEEKAAALERQAENEARDVAKYEADQVRMLAAVHASSVEDWHKLADKARVYQDAWKRRQALQEQLEAVLREQDIEELRQQVANDGPCPEAAARTLEEIEEEREKLAQSLETQTAEEHALEIAITQRSAKTRSLNEIEEEIGQVTARLQALSVEMDAASYAAAVIEEAARDTHARIAPRLARLAGHHLKEITSTYEELFVSRDLEITVRIPQTNRLDQSPKLCLSKGTVDQIYLSLRLALLNALNEDGETVPMLLDDPFGNYDDQRLERTLRLLAHIGETSQVLLFTCRNDVADAARAVNAPVLEL